MKNAKTMFQNDEKHVPLIFLLLFFLDRVDLVRDANGQLVFFFFFFLWKNLSLIIFFVKHLQNNAKIIVFLKVCGAPSTSPCKLLIGRNSGNFDIHNPNSCWFWHWLPNSGQNFRLHFNLYCRDALHDTDIASSTINRHISALWHTFY